MSFDLPDDLLSKEQCSCRRRGDETFDPYGRNRGREYYRRRGPSEDRTDGGRFREYDPKHRPFEEGRRRSQDRDVDLDQRREYSRSRSREPEQLTDGAKGSSPKAEKEKGRATMEKDTNKTNVEHDRKKSRSPAADRESPYKLQPSQQQMNAVSILKKLATQFEKK